ncbi:hypothetical protein M5C72_09315 [Companilactobacillus allii]|uniref:Uncharacterized protein n=1 Tax=Companilactobacillus allii TaxID=1847728 RepID=A0A1P8Q5W0_9LACO|nr:hypothetical protein [Companilactobacillus allii]APX73259.1 hypothetical protein BTM29_12200 [Companilactobacillus allii]USQ68075.1 hypothetical protein M5C72_09315 [Companilactobacillus allii]
MNTLTIDIILAMVLIVVINNPILSFLKQSMGLSFIFSEIIIAIIIIVIIYLINKFVIKRIMKYKK